MSIGIRLKAVLKGASISPRILAAITDIHYTSIYRLMSEGPKSRAIPVVEKELTTVLDKMESLTNTGELPMHGKLSAKEKTDRLAAMLAAND